MRLARLSLPFVAAFVSLVGPALASDYYVDAVGGSNGNTGSSPAQAWRTVSFAMGALPAAGSHVLHVAPGTYDAALGEAFPVLMRPDLVMQGDAGAAATILDATGASAALRFESSAAHVVKYTPSTSRTQGFTILAGQHGVELEAAAFETSPKLLDLSITGASDAGIAIHRDGGTLGPWIQRVKIGNGALGLSCHVEQGFDSVTGGVYLLDCTITGNTSHGVFFLTEDGSETPLFDRVRIESNGGDGLHGQMLNGPVNLMALNCSFSGNAGMGIVQEPSANGTLHVNLTRCTVAHNGSSGVKIPDFNAFVASYCILWGNAPDIGLAGVFVGNCDIGTGVFLPGTNFSADPLFVDPGALDLRLKWGSPCLELGPGASVGALDLSGEPRLTDGNLDTVRKADLGAWEFQPLHLQGAPAIGTTPVLQLSGATGATCLLFLSLAPPVAGKATKFGHLDLDLSNPVTKPFLSVAGVPAAPGPPAGLPLPIPPDTALLGLPVTFQGITTSTAAPAGGAFTNPVALVLQ